MKQTTFAVFTLALLLISCDGLVGDASEEPSSSKVSSYVWGQRLFETSLHIKQSDFFALAEGRPDSVRIDSVTFNEEITKLEGGCQSQTIVVAFWMPSTVISIRPRLRGHPDGSLEYFDILEDTWRFFGRLSGVKGSAVSQEISSLDSRRMPPCPNVSNGHYQLGEIMRAMHIDLSGKRWWRHEESRPVLYRTSLARKQGRRFVLFYVVLEKGVVDGPGSLSLAVPDRTRTELSDKKSLDVYWHARCAYRHLGTVEGTLAPALHATLEEVSVEPTEDCPESGKRTEAAPWIEPFSWRDHESLFGM